LFDAARHSTRIAGEVSGFDPLQWIDRKDVKKCGRFIQFAIAATEMAVEQSGLEVHPGNAARVGVIIGSGIGGFEVIEREHRVLLERGPDRVSPFFILSTIINLAAGQVSVRLGAKGPNSAVATACTTGAHAIGDAARIIQGGFADAMVCGGTEASITPLSVAGFAAMRALSTRNDDLDAPAVRGTAIRDGFVVGEAPECWSSKRSTTPVPAGDHSRRAHRLRMSADAHHLTAPPEDGDGVARVMAAALEDAGLDPSDIQYVNAHATSTPLGDHAEASRSSGSSGSIRRAGGELHEVDDRPSAGGCGRTRSRLDRACPAGSDCAAHRQSRRAGRGRPAEPAAHRACALPITHAMTNSFGFGGTNASLVFSHARVTAGHGTAAGGWLLLVVPPRPRRPTAGPGVVGRLPDVFPVSRGTVSCCFMRSRARSSGVSRPPW
jgi:3-oxoacyl-[acyl-carrier-protein] synthase II